MKSLYYFLLFGLLTTTACNKTSVDNAAQSKEETTNIETPTAAPAATQEVEETAKERVARMQAAPKLEAPMKALPQKLEIKSKQLCQNKYGCLSSDVYPIGWSEDGKFAYYIKYAEEARDIQIVEFVIQDLVNNKRIERASFKEDLDFDATSIWTNRYVDFKMSCEANNINIGDISTLKSFPIKWQGQSINCIDESTKMLSDYTGKEVLASSTISLQSKEWGDKLIAQKKYGKYDLMLDAEVLGYFQKANDDQIIVVYGEEKRGFEGPPNVLELSFFSANLSELEASNK